MLGIFTVELEGYGISKLCSSPKEGPSQLMNVRGQNAGKLLSGCYKESFGVLAF